MFSDLEPLIVEPVKPEPRPIEFPRFKELPAELRIQIWLHTLPPGCHIDLDTYVSLKEDHDNTWLRSYGVLTEDHNTVVNRNTPDLPVTLFVNHESREEALRHYCIIFPQDFLDRGSCKPKPLCLDPSKDSFYFSLYSVLLTYPSRFKSWLEFLDHQIPGGLQKFKTLEAREVSWADIECENFNSYSWSYGPLKRTFSMFTGLSEIAITLPIVFSDNAAMEDWSRVWGTEDEMLWMPSENESWVPAPPRYTLNNVLRKLFGFDKCEADKKKAPNFTFRKWQPAIRFAASNMDGALQTSE